MTCTCGLKAYKCEDHDIATLQTENEVGVLISQFLLFMQQKSIWPCHVFIGDDPQELKADELLALKDDFKSLLEAS